jgi:hypothetical protein
MIGTTTDGKDFRGGGVAILLRRIKLNPNFKIKRPFEP